MHTRGAATLYVLLKGAASFLVALVYTIELIYQIKTVGLNPFQLVLAGTVNQIVCFLFQAPTGALADLYSRRWAIVGGLLLTGSGFLIEGLIPAFAAVLVAQALWGLGASLMDGADAAWIADELGAEHAGPVYLRATQIGWLATLPGIALSAGLGSVRLNLPIALSGGLYLALALALAVVMPERHFTPSARADLAPWRQMQSTLRAGARLVRWHPVLLSILGIGALYGVFGEGFGRLWQYHLLHAFTIPALGHFPPIIWFGIIETVIALTSALGIEVARRRIDTNSHRAVAWALFIVTALTIAAVAVFALAGQFALALAALWLMTTVQGPHIPLVQAWMNQHLDSSVRATVFSVRGQVSALAAICGAPLIGAFATTFTTRPALLLSGLILAPALLLYARTMRRDKPLVVASAAEVEQIPGSE